MDEGVWVFYSREQIETPPKSTADMRIVVDNWWVVNEKGEVCLYRDRAPQCNPYRSIAEKVGKANVPGFAGVEQIPVAYVPLPRGTR